MRSLFLLVLSSLVFHVISLELPSIHADSAASKTNAARWWTRLGDQVYYHPATSFLGLSQNVSGYYYVMGSKSALSATMREHVVGSQGRWHIMHLPQGPSMLQLGNQISSGDRRSAFSTVQRLKSGTVLSDGFPPYMLSSNYMHPLDAQGQALEKAVVALITPETTMGYLKMLTEDFPTRSYSNAKESDKVEHFLKKQFEDLGIHTCLHSFSDDGKTLVNVVAHIPGTHPGSVIVGAHYDSRPFDGRAPGAEDNGSGVASLLAMAQALTARKVVPKRSVFFVGFAGEEIGLIGSNHFAQALHDDALPTECVAHPAPSLVQKWIVKRTPSSGQLLVREPTAAQHRAIIMDEIGWASPKMKKHTVNLESYDGIGTEVMDHLKQASQMHNSDDLDVVHNSNPFGSDHMSFLNLNMGASLTINGDDEAYPHYHQSTDTIDNVDGSLMAKITKMNLGGLLRMCLA